jgi:L-lactate dehydrogenase complex protein LldF
MGAVLTPSLIGVEKGGQLPNASTFCGRCEAVCPMRIPLPGMMRHWREREFERHLTPGGIRSGLNLWAWFAKRPQAYRIAARLGVGLMGWLGRKKGVFKSFPGAAGWTVGRDLPVPSGRTFMDEYARRQRAEAGR